LKHQGLSATERIKSRKGFEEIYSDGRIMFSSDKKIKAVYVLKTGSDKPGIKIAAAVSKKSGIAVWRNRVKRLIRESYRLNKSILSDECTGKGVMLMIVFSPGALSEKLNKKLVLEDILPGVLDVMNKIKSRL
jgi:ribonuclease P protein component